jgi:hypothetical protein
MLAAAGGPRRAANFHGDAVEHQRGGQMGQALDREGRVVQELAHRSVGKQRRQILHGLAPVVEGQLPVEHRRQLGHQITHPGEPQDARRAQADLHVDHNPVGQRGGQGAPPSGDGQAGLRAAKAVVAERRGHGEIGASGQEGEVFGRIQGLAAAQAHQGLGRTGQPGEQPRHAFEIVVPDFQPLENFHALAGQPLPGDGLHGRRKPGAGRHHHPQMPAPAQVQPQALQSAALDAHKARMVMLGDRIMGALSSGKGGTGDAATPGPCAVWRRHGAGSRCPRREGAARRRGARRRGHKPTARRRRGSPRRPSRIRPWRKAARRSPGPGRS